MIRVYGLAFRVWGLEFMVLLHLGFMVYKTLVNGFNQGLNKS